MASLLALMSLGHILPTAAAVEHAQIGCADIDGWVDSHGDGCRVYAAQGGCDASRWQLASFAVNGVDAGTACQLTCPDFCANGANVPDVSPTIINGTVEAATVIERVYGHGMGPGLLRHAQLNLYQGCG